MRPAYVNIALDHQMRFPFHHYACPLVNLQLATPWVPGIDEHPAEFALRS